MKRFLFNIFKPLVRDKRDHHECAFFSYLENKCTKTNNYCYIENPSWESCNKYNPVIAMYLGQKVVV